MHVYQKYKIYFNFLKKIYFDAELWYCNNILTDNIDYISFP